MFAAAALRRQFTLYSRLGKPLFPQQLSYSFSAHQRSKMAELLKGVDIVLSDGSKVKAEEHLKGKVVALYFSAGWCRLFQWVFSFNFEILGPPCRAYTPKLKVTCFIWFLALIRLIYRLSTRSWPPPERTLRLFLSLAIVPKRIWLSTTTIITENGSICRTARLRFSKF